MMGDDREITEGEANLWDYVTQDDKRWKPVKTGKTGELDEDEEKIPPVLSEPQIFQQKLPAEKEWPHLSAGDMSGLDKSTAEKFRKGKLKIEARLDLHGMTQNEAMRELFDFIPYASDTGKKCVVIITGKGFKPDGSIGVLRANLPHWLNLPQLRPYIIAFAQTQPKDGGEGAVYVLLRRWYK
jgi:DNA-nicking Smr family endonuclease